MVTTVSPNARATPANPIPSPVLGPRTLAARTALPVPPKTRTNVPMNSAPILDESFIDDLPERTLGERSSHLRRPIADGRTARRQGEVTKRPRHDSIMRHTVPETVALSPELRGRDGARIATVRSNLHG